MKKTLYQTTVVQDRSKYSPNLSKIQETQWYKHWGLKRMSEKSNSLSQWDITVMILIYKIVIDQPIVTLSIFHIIRTNRSMLKEIYQPWEKASSSYGTNDYLQVLKINLKNSSKFVLYSLIINRLLVLC